MESQLTALERKIENLLATVEQSNPAVGEKQDEAEDSSLRRDEKANT